jgi:hypothetical protein
MSKDSDDCEVMNELFDSGKDDTGYYNHWRPIAWCNVDGTKIRDLTKQEQLEWIKKQKERTHD